MPSIDDLEQELMAWFKEFESKARSAGYFTGGTLAILGVDRQSDKIVCYRKYTIRPAEQPAPAIPTPTGSGKAIGAVCYKCGNSDFISSGTCLTCKTCGETTGCS